MIPSPASAAGGVAQLDADLQRAVRQTGYMRQLFYVVVLLVALAGQVSGAVEALGIPLIWAIPAVGALELGGVVVLANADVRRRLGERATASRFLSAAIAAFAVAFNWLAHDNKLLAAFFAGMSALGYLVWLMHTENQRRDRLRATGDLPAITPAYELVAHYIRHPWLTTRAKSLAKADPDLGLYSSMAAARAEKRKEVRTSAIAKVLHRKIRAAVDPTTADIAVAVYDLDEIALRLTDGADYDGLTGLIAVDLAPARIAGGVTPDQPALTGGVNPEQPAIPGGATREQPALPAGSTHEQPNAVIMDQVSALTGTVQGLTETVTTLQQMVRGVTEDLADRGATREQPANEPVEPGAVDDQPTSRWTPPAWLREELGNRTEQAERREAFRLADEERFAMQADVARLGEPQRRLEALPGGLFDEQPAPDAGSTREDPVDDPGAFDDEPAPDPGADVDEPTDDRTEEERAAALTNAIRLWHENNPGKVTAYRVRRIMADLGLPVNSRLAERIAAEWPDPEGEQPTIPPPDAVPPPRSPERAVLDEELEELLTSTRP